MCRKNEHFAFFHRIWRVAILMCGRGNGGKREEQSASAPQQRSRPMGMNKSTHLSAETKRRVSE